ncbi:hypothetical protein HDV02_004683 [Globomyces sp. JEL0801]|nr:hypothetical protein HDV02_004683 [Globomyces sp. JEL0801]
MSGSYYLTSQWYNKECETPPDVMYGFQMVESGVNTSRKKTNETWPIGYWNQANRAHYNSRCTNLNLKVPLTKECCSVAIDMVKAKGYLSSMTVNAFAPNDKLLSNAPASINGASYCALVADKSVSGSLYGFDRAYYRATGVCIGPENVQCFSNGTIAMYPSDKCTGDPVSVDLASTSAIIGGTALAATGSLIKITEGTKEISWKMSVDLTTKYYPTGQSVWEVMFFVFYAIAHTIIAYTIYHKMRHFLKRKTAYNGAMILGQLLWLAHVFIRCIANRIGYTSTVDGLVYLFSNSASLLTVTISTKFILDMQKVSVRTHVIAYTIWTIIHFGLNWNHYLRFQVILFTPDMVRVVKVCNPLWIYLVYIFDITPPLYVTYTMLKSSGQAKFQDAIALIYKADKYFLFLFGAAFADLVLYFTVDQLKNNSELLGDDRNWICILSLEALSVSLQGCIVVSLIDRMTTLVRSGKISVASQFSAGKSMATSGTAGASKVEPASKK